MTIEGCSGLPQNAALEETGGIVAEAMVRSPDVLPADAQLGRVRAAFDDDHIHMVLLTDGDVLRGTLLRGDAPDTAPDLQKALRFAQLADRTVSATAPTDEVLQWLTGRQQRRLAVVDDHGRLVGLLCLKASGTGFCSDADVASRARGPSREAHRA